MENTTGDKVLSRFLEDEMRDSFIDYSMSVIVQRALPDVRDGLKPVHRRILYAMSELGLSPTRAYKKSATVVGDVLGKYHPHGDSAVYDSLVRMAQDFSLRYPLVDGQGNFGSIDGDSAAAYRYTEARLMALASELLEDIDKETVDFTPNFDGRLEEPTVLPSKVPNLLVNGSSGIAVGMATNIPPHNLGEVVRASVALIDDPQMSDAELETIVPGPGLSHWRIHLRGGRASKTRTAPVAAGWSCGPRPRSNPSTRTRNGSSSARSRSWSTSPRLIEQIAQLVRDKKLTSIRDMRDESDRDGLRVVIELKRDAVPEVVLNRLYKHTQMQSTFGVILLALVDGVPRVLTLRQMLQHFIDHRHDVVVKRSEFDLKKAKAREHILEGLKIAVDNIDEVVAIIRSSEDTDEASVRLKERFELSDKQADAILQMRLGRLTGLEMAKLDAELEEVRATIADLEEILGSQERRYRIIVDELEEIERRFGDERRSEIIGDVSNFNIEDLIVEEDMVLTVSHQGYIKRVGVDTYRAQRRGGRGLRGMQTKDEDWVEHLFVASTHDVIMIFTRDGQCHWLKVWQVPQAGRASQGQAHRQRAEHRRRCPGGGGGAGT